MQWGSGMPWRRWVFPRKFSPWMHGIALLPHPAMRCCCSGGFPHIHPRPDQLNLMWNISHPDKVCDAEYNLYDHVFVASTGYAERLSARLDVPVTPLLQCTDARRFFIEKSHMDDPLGISFPLSINGEGEGHEKKEGYSEALDKSEEILSEEIFMRKDPRFFLWEIPGTNIVPSSNRQ